MGCNSRVVSPLLQIGLFVVVVPDGNIDGVIGDSKPPRSDKKLNVFVKKPRCLEPLHENVL